MKGSIAMKNNFDSKTSNSTEDNTSLSNCHHTGSKKDTTASATVSETNSDQDSANSKYVADSDNRERRDGPGGN